MFPASDFSSIFGLAQDLQGMLARMANAGVVLALKIGLLWLAYQLAAAFLPRWYRPLLALGVIALVVACPAQLSALGDAAVGALFRAGLVPQVTPPDLASAAALPGLDGLATQVEATANGYVNWITSQLGF